MAEIGRFLPHACRLWFARRTLSRSCSRVEANGTSSAGTRFATEMTKYHVVILVPRHFRFAGNSEQQLRCRCERLPRCDAPQNDKKNLCSASHPCRLKTADPIDADRWFRTWRRRE